MFYLCSCLLDLYFKDFFFFFDVLFYIPLIGEGALKIKGILQF